MLPSLPSLGEGTRKEVLGTLGWFGRKKTKNPIVNTPIECSCFTSKLPECCLLPTKNDATTSNWKLGGAPKV